MDTNHSNIVIRPAVRSAPATSGVPQMNLWDEAANLTVGGPAATPEFIRSDAVPRTSSARPLLFLALLFLIPVGVYFFDPTLLPDVSNITSLLSFFENAPEDGPAGAKANPEGLSGAGGGGASGSEGLLDANGNPKNPYWSLPNYLESPAKPLGRSWTPDEEDDYTAKIGHRFQWQRYQAVQDLARQRLTGSEAVLWEALEQPKLWIRMRAAAALADFGTAYTLEVGEKAVGQASGQLVANFLKRFVEKSTEGERYLLRQVIRLVDEAGRLAILKALVKYPGELRDLYAVAAQFDPGPSIQKWSRFKTPEIAPAAYRRYRDVVLGKATISAPEAMVPSSSSKPQKNPSKSGEAPHNSGGLLQIDNVEIFDIERAAATLFSTSAPGDDVEKAASQSSPEGASPASKVERAGREQIPINPVMDQIEEE